MVVFRLVPVLIEGIEYQSPVAEPPATTPVATLVPREVDSTLFFETGAVQAGYASRNESVLVQSFVGWLGHEAVARWAIRVPEENIVLLTDIYDPDDGVLYEAKASSARGSVRLALGQLLDYRRHIPVDGLRSRVLVPSRPGKDLVSLLNQHSVGLAWADEGGGFQIED